MDYYLIDPNQSNGTNLWLISKVPATEYHDGMQLPCGGSTINGTDLVRTGQITVICTNPPGGKSLKVDVYNKKTEI